MDVVKLLPLLIFHANADQRKFSPPEFFVSRQTILAVEMNKEGIP
jgi:hypothetical protein